MNFKTLSINNILRDKWNYMAYFLSSSFSVLIFFIFSVAMFHPSLSIIQYGSALSLSMLTGNMLIYVFSFFFISFAVGTFIKNREKNLGIFIINGASKKQMDKMLLFENLFLGVLSIVTGMTFGLILSPLALMIFGKTLGLDNFNFYFPTKAILLTGLSFLILFFAIGLIYPKFLKKKPILNLLKSDKDRDTTFTFNLKFVILGVILLVAYPILLKFKSENNLIFDTFALIYATTSLLYSIYLLSALSLKFIIFYREKNANYYKGINMLFISDLKSKSKTNINMVFILTTLFITIFTIVTALFGMRKDVEAKTIENYPFSYTYIVDKDTVNPQVKLDFMRNELKDNEGILEVNYRVFVTNPEDRVGIISENDYNKVSSLDKRETISLNSDEIFLVPGSKGANLDYLNTNFTFLNDSLKPVGTSEKFISPQGYFNFIVVINDEVFNSISTENLIEKDIYSFNSKNWIEELDQSRFIRDFVTDGGENPVGFFEASSLYATEKNTKDLQLFVGLALGFVFLISASSLVYFKLLTERQAESERYKSIFKLGMSKKDFKKIIKRNIGILMFLPFILASIYLFLESLYLKQFGDIYGKIAIINIIVFFLIQSIGFTYISSKYSRSILEFIEKDYR